MLPNPSHLETVNPVALGKARSKMDQVRDKTGDRVLTVLIHGDAAFSGQGVIYEGLQMEILKGYSTHGTVHVVFNNHVGFTANPSEGRSSSIILTSTVLHRRHEVEQLIHHPRQCRLS
jgi:2-oxoglutarate dehydrogenase complex dehydrogenase (E1) component-like enzyme